MRILVLGGTRFVGRHMAAAALARGHEVTLVHRGRTGADLFPQAEHLAADRDGDLSGLAGRAWDATLDVCAYVPRQVHAVADALGGRGGRYLLVSTTSVYQGTGGRVHDEGGALVALDDPATEEVTDRTYGGLKVRCEEAARERFGDRLTVVRPTYVVGPYDHTHRFTWWVERVARGGEVLAPGPRDDGIQVIDARDLGDWTVRLVEDDVSGTFHAVSPPPPFTFEDLLTTLVAEVGPPGTTLTWVDARFLTDAGVDGRALPLWTEGNPDEQQALDPSRAHAAGLAPRPLRVTARELLAEERARPTRDEYGVGLPPEREAELLAAWREQGGGQSS